jgi:hypothetical protein
MTKPNSMGSILLLIQIILTSMAIYLLNSWDFNFQNNWPSNSLILLALLILGGMFLLGSIFTIIPLKGMNKTLRKINSFFIGLHVVTGIFFGVLLVIQIIISLWRFIF